MLLNGGSAGTASPARAAAASIVDDDLTAPLLLTAVGGEPDIEQPAQLEKHIDIGDGADGPVNGAAAIPGRFLATAAARAQAAAVAAALAAATGAPPPHHPAPGTYVSQLPSPGRRGSCGDAGEPATVAGADPFAALSESIAMVGDVAAPAPAVAKIDRQLAFAYGLSWCVALHLPPHGLLCVHLCAMAWRGCHAHVYVHARLPPICRFYPTLARHSQTP